MLEIYQHIPWYINPIAFSIGFFEVHWYAVMYLVSFVVIYWLLKKRAQEHNYSQSLVFDFLIYAIIGLLIGARLGYVFFYSFSYFLKNPIMIVSPYDFTAGAYAGIYGMSYFGGLIGIILATLVFIRRYRINFWQWADFIIPAVPAGYFFGRIGNFLNGELYGRATDRFWGMYFSGGGEILRHPSQLYEAFLEGIILFVVLWSLRDKSKFPGYLFCLYLFGYGFFRILVEFFREPDAQAGLFFNFLTLGQIFSLGLIISSLVLYSWQRKRKMVK
jgi:phosphatidylglycerol:prolipoprotein diacylglycerol transferase